MSDILFCARSLQMNIQPMAFNFASQFPVEGLRSGSDRRKIFTAEKPKISNLMSLLMQTKETKHKNQKQDTEKKHGKGGWQEIPTSLDDRFCWHEAVSTLRCSCQSLFAHKNHTSLPTPIIKSSLIKSEQHLHAGDMQPFKGKLLFDALDSISHGICNKAEMDIQNRTRPGCDGLSSLVSG